MLLAIILVLLMPLMVVALSTGTFVVLLRRAVVQAKRYPALRAPRHQPN
jgi:hypothetical protein